MRRLPPERIREIIPDLPENCSALFLSTLSSGTVLVDSVYSPKLLAITYRTAPPPMYFLYGEPDQYIIVKRFFKGLRTDTDLVIPNYMQNTIGKFWPIRFSVPIVFFAGGDNWRPEAIQSPNPEVRLEFLTVEDSSLLYKFYSDHDWLWEFFITPERLIKEGQVVAAFIGNETACIAATLAFTERYAELGVITRPEYRGRGLALDCCQILCKAQYEIFGRLPCWRTQSGNIGSVKVAKNLKLEETPSSGKFTFISNYSHIGSLATLAP